MKISFDQNLENSNVKLRDIVIQLLKQGSSAESIVEATALDDLAGDIARSNGPIEVSNDDLELLEKNFNKLLENKGSRVPNEAAAMIGRIIKDTKGD